MKNLIAEVSRLRNYMWPSKHEKLHIDDFDHLVGVVTEEVGELRGAVRSYLGRPFSPEKTASQEDIFDEFGDILVGIVGLSDLIGCSFEEGLDRAQRKLQRRCKLSKAQAQDDQ